MRMIDADEIKRYKERLVVDVDKIDLKYRYVVDVRYIDGIPTIDAVPVVRCRECRWYDPRTKNCLDGLYGVFEPDWFCKDGQRREDGDA